MSPGIATLRWSLAVKMVASKHVLDLGKHIFNRTVMLQHFMKAKLGMQLVIHLHKQVLLHTTSTMVEFGQDNFSNASKHNLDALLDVFGCTKDGPMKRLDEPLFGYWWKGGAPCVTTRVTIAKYCRLATT